MTHSGATHSRAAFAAIVVALALYAFDAVVPNAIAAFDCNVVSFAIGAIPHPPAVMLAAVVLPQLTTDGDHLVPDHIVARQWFQVCLRTLARWDANPALKFPRPVRVMNRKYRRVAELIEFMRAAAVARASDRSGVPDASRGRGAHHET